MVETKTTTRNPYQIVALREAGHVTRFHNVRHVGGEVDVAAHSWQCAVLLLSLHPDPSLNLVQAVLFHDVAERYTGDIPYPATLHHEFREAKAAIEPKAMEALGVKFELTDEEKFWLKCVDKLELLMWCEDQKALGNRHVTHVEHIVREWFIAVYDDLPDEVLFFLNQYRWMRTDERIPQSTK